jgi:B12 binding domain
MGARPIELLLRHDRNAACAMVVDAVHDGLPFIDVCLMLLQPLLYRIGDLWESGSLDVAMNRPATHC